MSYPRCDGSPATAVTETPPNVFSETARASPPFVSAAASRLGERIVHDGRDGASKRTSAVLLIESLREHLGHRRACQGHLHALDAHPRRGLAEHDAANLADGLPLELLEAHDLVQTVEHLRTEEIFELLEHLVAHAFVRRAVAVIVEFLLEVEPQRLTALRDHLAPDVGREHDERVLERHHAPRRVGQAPVLHHLQQNVEDVRVRLFNLVEEQDRERRPSHRLRERPALAEPDVPGRRAHELRHGVPLHVLGHVQTHHVIRGAKVLLRERLGQLRLAHPRGAGEEHRRDRSVRVLETAARASQRSRDRAHRLLLTDDARAQGVVHGGQRRRLVVRHALDRDPRPLRGNGFNVADVDDGPGAAHLPAVRAVDVDVDAEVQKVLLDLALAVAQQRRFLEE
eukprot:31181-Pelagococcus_subviridis.AAC.12